MKARKPLTAKARASRNRRAKARLIRKREVLLNEVWLFCPVCHGSGFESKVNPTDWVSLAKTILAGACSGPCKGAGVYRKERSAPDA